MSRILMMKMQNILVKMPKAPMMKIPWRLGPRNNGSSEAFWRFTGQMATTRAGAPEFFSHPFMQPRTVRLLKAFGGFSASVAVGLYFAIWVQPSDTFVNEASECRKCSVSLG